jgi:hypothetical protein
MCLRVREPSGRRDAQRAWCLYDWANSAFATSVVAAILPVYFARTAAHSMPAHEATALWGYASAAALAVTAVLSPVVGALADQTRRRKPILLVCLLLGTAGTMALSLVPAGGWYGLIAAFGVAFIAFATGNVLYDSLLPAVPTWTRWTASRRGFAGLHRWRCCSLHLAIISMPQRFGSERRERDPRGVCGVAWWLGRGRCSGACPNPRPSARVCPGVSCRPRCCDSSAPRSRACARSPTCSSSW